MRRLADGRFAVNCGVVGKPDHDGDPSVHYALIDLPGSGEAVVGGGKNADMGVCVVVVGTVTTGQTDGANAERGEASKDDALDGS